MRLDDVQRALDARDPDLSRQLVALASADDPAPDKPVREGALTFAGFQAELRSRAFRRKPATEQASHRIEAIKRLEAPDAEVPLPDRLELHTIIRALWNDNGPFARQMLLEVIDEVPLRWGPWRALKQILKEAEARRDLEIYGALAARFDRAYAASTLEGDVSRRTLGYLVRRAWRFLRRTAETLPACYADAAVETLRFYDDDTAWARTWVANHIFYHDNGHYSRRRFRFARRPSTLLKYRAFAELWRRSPRPLFGLLERARAEQTRRFATQALKNDFRASLREIEPTWVIRLAGVHSRTVDDFVIWLLANVPRFEQSAYRSLGLHGPVLTLLDSHSDDARTYAAAYARTHARDLSLDALIRLANNAHEGVRAMVRDLLRDRDPRKQVGLEGWGRLLGTPYGHALATQALHRHFGARELTSEWFARRLRASNDAVVAFAVELLPRLHTDRRLGVGFYRDLLDGADLEPAAVSFALDGLQRFSVEDLGAEFIKQTLLNPACTSRLIHWIEEERVPVDLLGVDYLKTLAFHGTWSKDPWVAELKASGRPWTADLEFDGRLSALALKLLRDVRRFSPDQIGFDWLMQLVERSEPLYHDFAVEYMTKAFLPADFAESEAQAPAEAPPPTAAAEEVQIDLDKQSFLFTGKLATMTRSQAKKKVSAANGSNASGVNAKLDYLVIGDEGSPLYGAGRKGSKQLKAEKLAAAGADLKIISETAFLQMLAGEQRAFDEGKVEAGCERLWAMATGPGDPTAPLPHFALHYLRRHHCDICPKETDRYVDPGAEIPDDFLTFERVRGLLADQRPTLRRFGLELCHWAFARWAPPMESIVALCELPHPEVRAFVTTALTADESPEHRTHRIDPAVLTADAVYRFCESTGEATRALGMALIARNPRLAIPEELFRLTESPDRQVRAFVIRQLWTLYRARGTTPHWLAPEPPPAPKGAKASQASLRAKEGSDDPRGAPPRPTAPPAGPGEVRDFLRRTLFGIPPSRLPKRSGPVEPESKPAAARLRPLPARRAKLALIDVVRDLAIEDAQFADRVVPLLEEFLGSRGQSERAACLVAITRIRQAHAGPHAASEESA